MIREINGSLVNERSRAIPLFFWLIASVSGFRFRFIGDIYFGEIIALLIVLDNFVSGKRRVSSKSKIDKFAYLWIFSQIVSNLVNHSGFTKSIIVLGSAMLTLFIIKAYLIMYRRGLPSTQILMYVFLGQAIAGIVQPKDYGLVNGWKFQYGYFLGAFLVLRLLKSNKVLITQFCLIGLTLISILNSARSLGAIFLIAFLFSIPNPIPRLTRKKRLQSVFRFLMVVTALISIYSLYLVGARAGYLGVKEISRAERLTSTIYGPLIGRSEVFYSVQAIQRKPILGYGGSPEVGRDLLVGISTKLNEQGFRNVGGGDHTPDTLPMHSILLGTAIFAGIPAAIFWLYGLIHSTKIAQDFRYLSRKERIPILLISISQLWNILFSPYGALLRLSISSSFAFLYVICTERDSYLRHQKGATI